MKWILEIKSPGNGDYIEIAQMLDLLKQSFKLANKVNQPMNLFETKTKGTRILCERKNE